jgi:hypothetical protein
MQMETECPHPFPRLFQTLLTLVKYTEKSTFAIFREIVVFFVYCMFPSPFAKNAKTKFLVQHYSQRRLSAFTEISTVEKV